MIEIDPIDGQRMERVHASAIISRRYGDSCGVAHALELLGERWAFLVLCELIFGPRRFSELRGQLPQISANVLTQRLRQLQARGLVQRVPGSAKFYETTDWARETADIIQALARWAVRNPRTESQLRR